MPSTALHTSWLRFYSLGAFAGFLCSLILCVLVFFGLVGGLGVVGRFCVGWGVGFLWGGVVLVYFVLGN